MTITVSMCTREMVRFVRNLGVETGSDEILPWKSSLLSQDDVHQLHIDFLIDKGELSTHRYIDDFSERSLMVAASALVAHMPTKIQNTFALPLLPDCRVKESSRHYFDGISIRGMLADVPVETEENITHPKEILRFDIAYRAAS